MAQTKNKGTLVATQVICITVGARPIKYQEREVLNRRTGERQVIPMTDPGWPLEDEGEDGVPYTFRIGQKIHPHHPAYADAKLNPVFIPLDEAEEMELVDV